MHNPLQVTTENVDPRKGHGADLDPNDITFLVHTFQLPRKVIEDIFSRVGADSRRNVLLRLRKLYPGTAPGEEKGIVVY